MAGQQWIKKLNSDQQAYAITRYIKGWSAGKIARKLEVSVRLIYKIMDEANVHRCRCGDVHERKSHG